VADSLDLPEPAEVRFAESEQDMVAMHEFLCVVAAPALRCPINPVKSLQEIIRVTRDEVALMLIRDGRLIGTMGLINPVWWYGDAAFITDRWHFVLPEFMNTPDAELLEDEAIRTAAAAGLEFIHQGKIRKGKRGVPRLMPRVYTLESDKIEGQGA
jgi:SAM-dependent methyltransferase